MLGYQLTRYLLMLTVAFG